LKPRSEKRNDFQRAEDRGIALEMLQRGHTLVQIAEHISSIRPYSISYQQIALDVSKLRMSAIAATTEHMAVIIDRELQEIENVLAAAWAAIKAERELVTTQEFGIGGKAGDYEKTKQQWINLTFPSQLLKIVLDAIARRSTLMGLDSHLKYLDTNAAIESLTRLGYEVSTPDNSSEGDREAKSEE
jgi:hypothetical protein